MLQFQKFSIQRSIPISQITQVSQLEFILTSILSAETEVQMKTFLKQLRMFTGQNIVNHSEIIDFLFQMTNTFSLRSLDLNKYVYQILADVAADSIETVIVVIPNMEIKEFYTIFGPLSRLCANIAINFSGQTELYDIIKFFELSILPICNKLPRKILTNVDQNSLLFVERMLPFGVLQNLKNCILNLANIKIVDEDLITLAIQYDYNISQRLVDSVQGHRSLNQYQLKLILYCLTEDSFIDYHILEKGLKSDNIQKRNNSGQIINKLIDFGNVSILQYIIDGGLIDILQKLVNEGEGYAMKPLQCIQEMLL